MFWASWDKEDWFPVADLSRHDLFRFDIQFQNTSG